MGVKFKLVMLVFSVVFALSVVGTASAGNPAAVSCIRDYVEQHTSKKNPVIDIVCVSSGVGYKILEWDNPMGGRAKYASYQISPTLVDRDAVRVCGDPCH